jgi:hypothetical protein
MQTFGSETEGFAVGLSDGARAIHVRVWGFWSAELATRFVSAVVAECSNHRIPLMTIDATELRPQRDAGQDALGALMSALPALGVTRARVTTASPLTRLQILRISKERAVKDLIQFVQ